jgi:hypothetical protein
MLAFFRRDYEKKEDVSFKTRIASKYLTPETKKYAIYGFVLLCVLIIMFLIIKKFRNLRSRN